MEPLYKPTALLAFLEKEGLKAKKSLSQNFLIDGNILRKILTVAEVKENEVVIEIGPGVGVLTQALLEKGCFVLSIEKDTSLGNLLKRLDPEGSFLTIFIEDALTCPIKKNFHSFLKEKELPLETKAKLVANIPYNITSPLLFHFLLGFSFLESLTLLMQKEVAEKCLATPGDKRYGLLALYTAFYSDAKIGMAVPRNSFYPAPHVDSAVLHVKLKKPPLNEKESSSFFEMLKKAFSQRRKILTSSLKDLYPKEKIEESLAAASLSLNTRPEDLSLEQFLSFFKGLPQK